MPLDTAARQELVGRISSRPVREAFELIVDRMDAFGHYDLCPNVKGGKKSLHFNIQGRSYLAFIANREWLLWYFRKPGFTDGVFTWPQLRTRFPSLSESDRRETENIEATLKISNVAMAEDVMAFVSELPVSRAG